MLISNFRVWCEVEVKVYIIPYEYIIAPAPFIEKIILSFNLISMAHLVSIKLIYIIHIY